MRGMVSRLLAVCFLSLVGVGLALAQQAAGGDGKALAIDVRVDPRVELLSIVFRLAGNKEYGQGRIPAYDAAIAAHFGDLRNHGAVVQAISLRATRGVSYDAVAGFAVHLDGADTLGELMPFDPLPERLDSRWTPQAARTFLRELRDFTVQGKANEFFAAQRDLYAAAEASMRDVLAEHADLDWYGRFFGPRPSARFQVVLGLVNGPSNYGPSVRRPDGEELYAIVGCWQVDADGRPRYDERVVPTLIHEFCHSYCNPVIDGRLDEFAAAGQRLFALFEAPMRQQAYGNGRTLLCESLVRACVVRYVATAQGEAAAKQELEEQVRRSFVWTERLALLLGEYERGREQWPTLDAFAPRLVEFFTGEAERQEAAAARRPKVVAMTPANGQQDVDPATTELVITFDRAMLDGGWSVVGGGEHFPKLGRPSYDSERKVLRVPVELRADWDYELWLNRDRFTGFRSAEGEVLAPVRVQFRTRAK